MRTLPALVAAAILASCSDPEDDTTGASAREAVLQARCEACHGPLSAHDGSARELAACGGCHGAGAVDAETGNALELGVLIHKVHRGRALPSVVAGSPYVIASGEEERDFSTVWYPQDLRRCTACHGGAQGEVWKTASVRACTSCHDRTALVDPTPEGMTLHGGGAQPADSCTTCHGESGEAPVAASHEDAPPLAATGRLELVIDAISQTAPGQQPVVTFRVKVDGAPRDILASPLMAIRVSVAGPTTDYARSWQVTAHGSGASGFLEALDAANGVFRYTLPASDAIPLDATGTYAVALYGRFQEGATSHLARNEPFFVAVTDPAPVPRRVVVNEAACDACHGELIGHNTYRGVQHCLFCHDAENAGDERIARFESTTVTAPSVHLKVLVHKIHRGAALVAQPYLVGGNPTPTRSNPAGTQKAFGTVRYPRDLRDCGACHLPGTYDLPLAPGALPSREEVLACTQDPAADTDSYCDTRSVAPVYVRPETAACTSCHDAPWTAAHAAVNTAPGGAESCTTCHGPGSAWAVDRVHAVSP
jgi:OmcA/MtrC family decaheme c-type cytochrome